MTNPMKLYYAPGTCSLAPHIVAREAGIPLDLIKVDLATHKTESGVDYLAINPRGYVPAVALDDGTLLTEASVVVQVLADRKPDSGLIPPAGSAARIEVQRWLAFVATELHKMFSPWLWSADTAAETKATVQTRLAARFAEMDRHLAGKSYLMGESFTVADAYAFTIVNWVNFLGMDLKAHPNLAAYVARVAARPKVHQALVAEGLAT